jgi:tape measure domain-containing protein
MTTRRVGVRLVAEGGRQVRAEFEGVGDSGERSFGRIEQAAQSTGAVVRRVLGILAGAVSIRQIVSYTNTWTDLRSRIDLATGSTAAGAAVMSELETMARRTYSSLEQTAESYLANATALRELGMSTRESLEFTEALNNAMVVSGARQQRAEMIQRAVSRAMAAGVLRGQELNTVIESGGRVAELLAQELGVTVSQLRGLGAQGRITGDVIRRALVGNLELLRDEADSMPATIGDAFTILGNAALGLVGRWDQMGGASATVAQAIILVADNLKRLASYGIAFAGFMAGRYVAGLVAAAVATGGLSGALVLLRAALIRTGIGALIVGAGELIYWFGRLVRGAGGFGAAMGLLGNVAGGVWRDIGQGARALWHTTQAYAGWIAQAFIRGFQTIFEGWDHLVNAMLVPFNMLMEATGQSFRLHAVNPIGTALGNLSETIGDWADRNALLGVNLWRAPSQAAEAWAELVAAMTTADAAGEDALSSSAASAQRVTDALNNAGGAARSAGQDMAQSSEVAATGWRRVAESLRAYATEAMDLAGQIGGAMVNAFRGAETAIGNFVRTGRFNFSELATSIMADLAQIAARRFILGPIASALDGVLGGLGGGMFGGVAAAVPIKSFDGGGHTGYAARSGGLDGRGGFLAMMHPQERVIDESRSRGRDFAGDPAPIHVHFHGVRDAESFRQSKGQVLSDLARAVQNGRRNM